MLKSYWWWWWVVAQVIIVSAPVFVFLGLVLTYVGS